MEEDEREFDNNTVFIEGDSEDEVSLKIIYF